jgi:hypothetical protein
MYAQGRAEQTRDRHGSRDAGGGVMASHIKLYGGKQERFEEIKNQLTDKLGYEPTNPEVMGILMAQHSSESADSANDARGSELLGK